MGNIATAKLITLRISPKKVRRVANVVRGKEVVEALHILSVLPQRACKPLSKLIKSAAANAEEQFGSDKEDLTIRELYVDEGVTLKRFQPRARGRAFSIMKRSSHLFVAVEDSEEEKE